MKNCINIAGCTEVQVEELKSIDGGSALIEILCYIAGRAFVKLAKTQERNGDNGQWMM